MRSPQRCWPHFFCCQNLHNSGSPVEKQTAVQWSGQKQFSEWTTVSFAQINTTFKSRFSYYMLLSGHRKSKPHCYTFWNWLCVLSKPCAPLSGSHWPAPAPCPWGVSAGSPGESERGWSASGWPPAAPRWCSRSCSHQAVGFSLPC